MWAGWWATLTSSTPFCSTAAPRWSTTPSRWAPPEDGSLIFSSSCGANSAYFDMAEKYILEVNEWQDERLEGMHDVFLVPGKHGDRKPIPVLKADDRVGTPYMPIDVNKVAAVVITTDSGPTEAIWRAAARIPHLKAVFLGASLPEEERELAAAAGHLTPALVERELAKMPAAVPVYAVHIKPGHRRRVVRQLGALKRPNLLLGDSSRDYEF